MPKTIALVTGANKGIGFEIARQLQEHGVTVLLAARDEERGKAAAAKLGVPFVRLDVTDPDSIKKAATWVDLAYGRLDVLVNNAGISVPNDENLPSATSIDTMRTIYETNVFGVVAVTNAFLPLLRKSPAGRIVNQSSEMGSLAYALDQNHPIWPVNNLAYNSSKTALNMVTVSYAKELWGTPIKVNAVAPGWCRTDITGGEGFKSAEQGAAIAVKLATLDADGPTGTFTEDQGTVAW
ncbi:SDR family oxidoreductase [Streptomyces sp. TLI_146]|uniref:SDR family oxidoreductase n=1 Tax=Streptomyces sp. TLI_146 TaxID=1938858 RepID=UPI000C70C93A|nr:SDR family oxidoreductase [Streptomyces sp. TLI_146]PKV83940.1 short-subunit dehydrogenase [Streptomyces sp. TLI_146]